MTLGLLSDSLAPLCVVADQPSGQSGADLTGSGDRLSQQFWVDSLGGEVVTHRSNGRLVFPNTAISRSL